MLRKKLAAGVLVALAFSSLTFAKDAGGRKMRKVTDGRDYLGAYAPKFAEINDDILFGKVWAETEKLGAKERSMITIAALIGSGITDANLKGHLQMGKENGITKDEFVEIVTQLAFYTGWPKAWSVFAVGQEVWPEEAKPKYHSDNK
ncbi:carboxymuconolactone decarboxylase family protein [uncultured Treponema sp.]|uniref:carboxymuconolactone decarboxylase family protein n=1 Tax=uncultured Treponema sp. TaxID=162155 RepID=UPI00262732CC|nr:carboxymuconolactone decarboxylase family protein [uncultured Treponema sp.]